MPATTAVPVGPLDDDLPQLAALVGPGFDEATPAEIEQLVIACVAAAPIDKLDGLPLVRMRPNAPCLAIVAIEIDGHHYVLTADHGRRVAAGLDEIGRLGAGLDLMQLCDDAEAAAFKIAGGTSH